MKLKDLIPILFQDEYFEIFLEGKIIFNGKLENFDYKKYENMNVFELFSYSETKDYDNYYSIIVINLKGE